MSRSTISTSGPGSAAPKAITMTNWRMAPYNKARLAVTGLFALAAIASGVQAASGKAPLEAHLFFVACTLVLASRVLWCFWKGRS